MSAEGYNPVTALYAEITLIIVSLNQPVKSLGKRHKTAENNTPNIFTRKTEKNQGFFRQNVKIASKIFALLQNRLNSGILKFMYGHQELMTCTIINI